MKFLIDATLSFEQYFRAFQPDSRLCHFMFSDMKKLLRSLTLIRVGGNTFPPWHFLLYNLLVTHQNFMKFCVFS